MITRIASRYRRLGLAPWLFLIVALLLTTGFEAHAQQQIPCPTDLPSDPPFPPGTACYGGQDDNGAYYLIAVPSLWNGALLLHNHGGPNLTPPAPLTSRADLGPVYIRDVLSQGWAVAASSYRAAGWGVTSAAADTENLRQLFVRAFGHPWRTIIEGTSFGATVTAIQAEKFAFSDDGTPNFDAAMPLCGLCVGTRLQGYLLSDQRTVYQYYCQNLPRPDEPQYDLFHGVDDPNVTTSAVIQARVNECTGVNLPPDQRTPEQQFALANIMSVISITSETDFNTRMVKGPLNLNNLTDAILGGRNAFHSLDVEFSRSSDDDALNAGVLRYAAERRAVRRLIKDGEPTGAVSTPVVTMHAEDDERAWPESESGYKDSFTQAGADEQLLQLFTTSGGHCGYSVAEFRAVLQNLMLWLNSGIKPTPSDVAGSCVGTDSECRFDAGYVPASWSSRQPPRSPY